MAFLAPPLPVNDVISESLMSLRKEPYGLYEAPELASSHLTPVERAILQLLKSMRSLVGFVALMARERALSPQDDDFMRGWNNTGGGHSEDDL